MNSAKSIAIAVTLAGVGGLSLSIQLHAGGDKVAFPENYAAGILYGTVDRYDVTAIPRAIRAVRGDRGGAQGSADSQRNGTNDA